jgi:hypothetical protein
MEERFLWRFYWDCGRQGSVEGLFVATESEVKEAIGRDVYFGEILGKYSEVSGTIEDGEIKKIDLDTETVERVTKLLGDTWSGYNPLEYISRECPICGDNYIPDEWDFKKNMCKYCTEEEKD